jgi:hypothetical protein
MSRCASFLLLACASGALAPASAGARTLDAGNVAWSFRDSVVGCPGGDSVSTAHPSRLRIVVAYLRDTSLPAAGVPPESIWVELGAATSNLRVNDQGPKIFADDSTDADGRARITLPSFSGCGTIEFSVSVSGTPVGAATASVRTTDADADGRATASEAPCDLDDSGSIGAGDSALVAPHLGHAHRHALFGTLVRRTNLCDSCDVAEEDAELSGVIGASTVSWSPDGRRLAFTIHTAPHGDCSVYIAHSDPRDGDDLMQFTFPDSGVHDYDPTWSPLGTEIAFGRADNTIWAKGVPGLAGDTTLRLVTRHNDATVAERGDLTPAFSPDGEWIAFTRHSAEGEHYHLWKTPADGDTTRGVQLTNEPTGDDFYPQWSPDGAWIVYDVVRNGKHGVYRVASSGGAAIPVLLPGGGLIASTPAYSPDGEALLLGVGDTTGSHTHVLDASASGLTLPSAIPVLHYPDQADSANDPILTPRLSPDGTRLALRTTQLFAARRNMSVPPRITRVAGQAIDHALPFVSLVRAAGAPFEITVEGSDPEDDPLTWHAYLLEPGMSFDAPSHTLSWTPPDSMLGRSVNVRFLVTTESGGCDYAIARIHVADAADVADAGRASRFGFASIGPNPLRTRATIAYTLPALARVRLEVFDVSGRRVRLLADAERPAGTHAVEWDGRDARGRRVAAGIYVCRLSAGASRAESKIVVVR